MSTSDASTAPASSPATATLPPGWSAGPPRETSATNQAGVVVQGVQLPLSNVNGAQTTVFIPYQALQAGVAAVQPIIDARLNGLATLPGVS